MVTRERSTIRQSGRTIRVSDESYAALSTIAQDEQLPIGDVVAELLREHEDREFFERLKDAAARLRSNQAEWAEFQEEMNAWDVALLDGLEDE